MEIINVENPQFQSDVCPLLLKKLSLIQFIKIKAILFRVEKAENVGRFQPPGPGAGGIPLQGNGRVQEDVQGVGRRTS